MLFALLTLAFAMPAPVYSGATERGIDESFFSQGGYLDKDLAGAPEGAPATSTPVLVADSSELAMTGMKIIGVLGFLALAAGGVYRFLRKSPISLFRSGLVKRIAIEPFGPSQFIQVVEIGGRILVLGVSEKGISKLTELDGESADSVRLWRSREDGREVRPSGVGFRGALESLGSLFEGQAPVRPERAVADGLAASRKRLQELAL